MLLVLAEIPGTSFQVGLSNIIPAIALTIMLLTSKRWSKMIAVLVHPENKQKKMELIDSARLELPNSNRT